MKNKILVAFITILGFSALSFAQGGVSVSLADLPDTNSVMIEAVFPTSFLGGVRVAEARLPATTQAACMASTDFSEAVPMNPARFRIDYNTETSSYHFSFYVERERRYGCRVVRFGGDGVSDANDFVVWQKGGSPSSSLAEVDLTKGDKPSAARFADGSVRAVKYSYVVGGW